MEIRTSIEIAASPETVWAILTDFDAFPTWNPLILSAQGQPLLGERLNVYLKPPEGPGMRFRPKVIVAQPNAELRWLGIMFLPGLFDGEHSFVMEQLDSERVRFRQEEKFRGILVPVLGRFIETSTRRGFEEMNAALKARAEANRSREKTPLVELERSNGGGPARGL